MLTGWRPNRAGDGEPELLVIAERPPEADGERLAALVAEPSARQAALVAGPAPGARWRWTVGEHGGLDLGPLGLAVETHVGELPGSAPAAGGADGRAGRRARRARSGSSPSSRWAAG